MCSSIFSHIHRRATRGEMAGLPCSFRNQKKCPDFENKGLDCIHLKFGIQNLVLRVFGTKISKMFPCRTSFSCAFDEMFIKCPNSTTFPHWPEKFLVEYLYSDIQTFFCKRLHVKCLTVFYISLNNCSVFCTVTLCLVLDQTHPQF